MLPFPDLPIVTPDPPRMTQAEKYGGLFYLGIAGLAVVLLLVGWFALGVWSMRAIWADTYALADPKRREEARINAAWRLARDPRVTERQKWDLALNKDLPDLARYVLAESLTSDAVVDSRAYGLAVAKSRGWPPWLRRLLAYPLALSAAEGSAVDPEPIREMALGDDPVAALWATWILHLSGPPDEAKAAGTRLDQEARGAGPNAGLARILQDASDLHQPRRVWKLEEGLRWMRDRETSGGVWKGWRETVDGIRPAAARGLHTGDA